MLFSGALIQHAEGLLPEESCLNKQIKMVSTKHCFSTKLIIGKNKVLFSLNFSQ